MWLFVCCRRQSAWLSALPFLSQYVFAMLYGSLADHLLQRGVRLVTVRKVSVVVCKPRRVADRDLTGRAWLLCAVRRPED